jgi:hypothetical protein
MPKAKPNAKAKAKTAPDPDPDRLVRQPDGGYRTEDGRFGVSQANGTWFLSDGEVADEFGQPRVTGPFATLKTVRDAIADTRSGPASAPRPIAPVEKAAKPKGKAAAPKPKTWLERLSAPERRRATALVKALEGLGLAEAEEHARRRIEGRADRDLPGMLLRARLDALLVGADEGTRERVEEVMQVLASGGEDLGPDVPGWAVVETDANGTLTDRRIELRPNT